MNILYSFVSISSAPRKHIGRKFISILLIFSLLFPECVRAMQSDAREEGFPSEPRMTSQALARDTIEDGVSEDRGGFLLTESDPRRVELSSPVGDANSLPQALIPERERQEVRREGLPNDEALDHTRNRLSSAGEFEENLQELSNNSLAMAIKRHVSHINGEQITEDYRIRKAVILITLAAGAVASFLGSLTFLIGRKFPRAFADLANFNISNSSKVADEVGETLGWCNVILESLFYTWTISGILPSLQPDEIVSPREEEQSCCSLLPTIGEWGLAVASTIPLTFLSLVDQETEDTSESLKYTIISSIALVTFVSNKFFLSLTHKQIKKVWTWLTSPKETAEPALPLLEETKKAFLETTIRANEKLKHLSRPEVEELIADLKSIALPSPALEEAISDRRWINLLNHMFRDLTFTPPEVNKKAMILVPSLAVFAACSWLGLIATVPHGVERKLSSSAALQYILMVIAGIPLLEIGLSMGGSFGYKLSQLGNGVNSLSENLTHPLARFLGYIPISLVGLGSFATTATLSIQQFRSIPPLAWGLLPSAVLGMDLINISSGTELWDEVLVEASTRISSDKALFVDHVKFLQNFQEKIEFVSEREIARIILALEPFVQTKIKQLTSSMRNRELGEWIRALRGSLERENTEV